MAIRASLRLPAWSQLHHVAGASLDGLRRGPLDHPIGSRQQQLQPARLTRRQPHALTAISHQQQGGFNLKPEHPSVRQATKTLERAERELGRLQARQAECAAAWQAAGGVLTACETWLRDGRPGGTTLDAVEVEVPKLAKGEDVLSGIDACADVDVS